MKPDDELCLCFHVTRRKVENYLRNERPAVPSQLADCFGAGTGCGWCRPILKKLFEAHKTKTEADLPDPAEHASGRCEHIASGAGTPPTG